MIEVLEALLGCALSFLIGSLPFSFWVAKIFRGIDIRTLGSGNAGATNVFRTQGKALGSLALSLDIAKGAAVIWVLYPFFASQQLLDPFLYRMICGLCAIAGHVWTPFLGWKGGKGVAVSAGVFLALMPEPFLIALTFFLIVFLITRIISASSMTAAAVFPAAVWIFYRHAQFLHLAFGLSLLVTLFIFYTHRANIGRIVRGEEKKL